ncbi:MAG: DUF423 domain-containing protein [Verrucomicrobia bacterium]|nr:MAG: DUF423 domain-containing protein [Verrucomicrobiota bacterium]
MNRSGIALRIGAGMGALAIALGAFGAHSWKPLLMSNGTTTIWEKAVFYHAIHAVMLFILGGSRPLRLAPWLGFLLGIWFFSGSLYVLAVTNAHWLGAITPIGGTCFMVGWIWLMVCPGKASSAGQD